VGETSRVTVPSGHVERIGRIRKAKANVTGRPTTVRPLTSSIFALVGCFAALGFSWTTPWKHEDPQSRIRKDFDELDALKIIYARETLSDRNSMSKIWFRRITDPNSQSTPDRVSSCERSPGR
jgi:hypothetical protein